MSYTPDHRHVKDVPIEPGAYMSSKDRSIWLFRETQSAGWAWFTPDGSYISPNAPLFAKIIAPHLPLRRMYPVKSTRPKKRT